MFHDYVPSPRLNRITATVVETEIKHEESRAIARKPLDAAAVLSGLNFANNVHYKFKSIAKLRKPGFRAPNIPAQSRT